MQITDKGLIAAPSGRHGGYVLVLLMLGYVLSFFDRQILVMMIEPIGRDLHLTDTHFGLLYGFLGEFGATTKKHVHLENNILFPQVVKLEQAGGAA